MKRIINYITLFALAFTMTQCDDYLSTSSPSQTDDEFVTYTTDETFKTISWCYANYRQNCIMGTYRWNDPIGSDAEAYPEAGSTNNINAKMKPESFSSADTQKGGFNALYSTLARASKIAGIIASKQEYKDAVKAGVPSNWTQLYGEAVTIWGLCYFDLLKHFGDVPYGYENTYVTEYKLTSRFDIYDNVINKLKEVEPLMYKIGEGGITAERMSRTFCNALIGQMALYSGGYQTIRTDIAGLYGSLTFDKIGIEEHGCVYARRSDYLEYYKTAKAYLQKAIDNKGTSQLITVDPRGYSNPFQLHFQYFHNKVVSPESLFELGNIQGGSPATTSEYGYAFSRPSNGGNTNAAPTKAFSALRILPTVYYGDFEEGDKRRDVSVAVTGSNGDGNEKMLTFKPGSKLDGGLSTNKWDENRMNPPFVTATRQSGMNWPILRMADVILMLAESKAVLGETDAIGLVNQIRERAFGNATHNLSGLTGQALVDAILKERKLELLGEGTRRWDLIRNGLMSKRSVEVRQEMKTMIDALLAQGYYTFPNGNVISNYIYTKKVASTQILTFECTDKTNPVLYPGWRGQYDYTTIAAVASKVVGTTRNVAILGLFNNISDANAPAGYTKTNWAIDLTANKDTYYDNILSGVTSTEQPPRYYWPIPYETVSKSKGSFTNGYGLPQQ